MYYSNDTVQSTLKLCSTGQMYLTDLQIEGSYAIAVVYSLQVQTLMYHVGSMFVLLSPGGVEFLLLQDPVLGLPAGLLLLQLAPFLLQLSVLGLQVLLHLLMTPLELHGQWGQRSGGQK